MKHRRLRPISSFSPRAKQVAYALVIILLASALLSARSCRRAGRVATKTRPVAKPPATALAVPSQVSTEDAPPVSTLASAPVMRAPKPKPKTEGRAVWVTRWDYESPADVKRIMRQVANANLNIVYFQVRGVGDAYYRSPYEPWAAALTGRLGKNPGWDPLSVAVTSAHTYGLQLHAWINVYPIWFGTTPPPRTRPLSPYYRSGWRVAEAARKGGRVVYPTAGLIDGYVWSSPGNPAVQNHVYRIAMDIVRRYDVDGLHMDRVRYPGAGYSYDTASRAAFAAADRAYRRSHGGRRLSRRSWQTGQVTGLVARIYRGVKNVKPQVQVSAASWGIHTNRWTWPSSDGLRDYYQDGQGWMQKGIVDFLAPMTYWRIRQTPPWGVLVKDFVRNRRDAGVYPGIAVYKFRGDWREVARQVRLGRRLGAQGFSFFDYASLAGRWDDLRRLFPKKVAAPTLSQPSPAVTQPSPAAAPSMHGE